VPFSAGHQRLIGSARSANVQATICLRHRLIWRIDVAARPRQIGTGALHRKSSAAYDITGRAGLTVGNALLYAKGGFAYFTGNVSVSYNDIIQNSGVFTGWTVGGGLEYKVTRTVSIKGEYLYFDLDNSNFSCCLPTPANNIDNNIAANTFRLGLNYNLNDLRSPLE
jgi:opacity protein-like surface antigen